MKLMRPDRHRMLEALLSILLTPGASVRKIESYPKDDDVTTTYYIEIEVAR